MKKVSAYANANIALVKYWGKRDARQNIPAVSSLSMTLDGLGTTVCLALSAKNLLTINGVEPSSQAMARTMNFLDYFSAKFGIDACLEITTQSSVPYAAGLASSASYFAALSVALDEYFSLGLTSEQLAALARMGSASAARSILGGFVGMIPEADSCQMVQFCPHESLDLVMVIAMCDEGEKKISSRQAMTITQETSPYFQAFVDASSSNYPKAALALQTGSLAQLGQIMEHSTLKMHACMWAAQPSINYLAPKTIEVMNLVYELRNADGLAAYFTMDAGPNVKILCEQKSAMIVAEKLQNSLGISKIYLAKPGAGAHVSLA